MCKIRPVDLAVLLYMVMRAGREGEFLDCNNSVRWFYKKYNQRNIYISKADLESMLQTANLSSEEGKFEHPLGLTIGQWLSDILGREGNFNKFFGFIKKQYEKKTMDS